MRLDEQNLPALARGCGIFGAGGGGDPALGYLMALHAVREIGPIDLVDLDDLPGDGLIISAAMMGAPTVMTEKIANGDEGARIRDRYEQLLGREVTAMMCLELGGINGVLPAAWAVRAGLPLVDADLMGRAFPELQMCSPHVYDRSLAPVIMSDERGNLVILETIDNIWGERLGRSASITFGGATPVCLYPMSVAEGRKYAIRNTMSEAIRIGEAIVAGEGHPIETLLEVVGGHHLIDGKLVDVERHTTGGFARGAVTIEGLGEHAGRLMRIEFQNENLVVLVDGEVLASVPDVITVLDTHTGEAIVTEQLRYGQRVTVVAFPSWDVWRTPKGLDVVGPRAFGYPFDYVPVEEIHAQAA